MSEEILERKDVLEKHLKALDAFSASDVYVGYLAARNAEIEGLQNLILITLPNTPENIALILGWHGELTSQTQMKQTFEQARVELKARIDETVERETENATNKKI